MAILTSAGQIQAPTPVRVPQVYFDNVAIGFEPKLVYFWWTSPGAINTVTQEFAYGFGAAVEPGLGGSGTEGLVDSAYIDAIANDNASSQHFTTAHGSGNCIYVRKPGPTYDIFAYASMWAFNSGSFDLRWTILENSAPTVVHFLAIGGDELTDVAIRQCLSPAVNSSKSFNGIGFAPDGITLFGARQPYPSGIGVGMSSMLGFYDGTNQASIATAGAYSEIPILPDTASQQLTTHAYNYIASDGTSQGKGEITGVDADGFTAAFTGMGAALNTYFWAVCLKGAATQVLAFDQPVSSGGQNVATNITPEGMLFASFGQPATTAIVGDSNLLLAGAAGTGKHGFIWSGSDDSASVTQYTRAQYDTVLGMYSDGNPGSLLAHADSLSLEAAAFTLQWPLVDASARQVIAFAIGQDPASSSSEPLYCSDRITNGQFLHGLTGWTHENAYVDDGHRLQLSAIYPTVYGTLRQTISGLAPGSEVELSFDVVDFELGGDPELTYFINYGPTDTDNIHASATTSVNGTFTLNTFVPTGGEINVNLRMAATSWFSARAIVDNITLIGCSAQPSSSFTEPGSSSVSPLNCFNQLVNSDFAHELAYWEHQNAATSSGEYASLSAEKDDPAYVKQLATSLVPATVGQLTLDVAQAYGSATPTITYQVLDGATEAELASGTATVAGAFEVDFIVPLSGAAIAKITVSTTEDGLTAQADLDNVELSACSYESSSSIAWPEVSSSSYAPEQSSSSSSSSSSLSVDDCTALAGDSFERPSGVGLGDTDGLATDVGPAGGDGLTWAGDAAALLNIVSGQVVRPFGATWPETLAYVDTGDFNGVLASRFTLNVWSSLQAAGLLLRVADNTSYLHAHITPTQISLLRDGSIEIARTTIATPLPTAVALVAEITLRAATITIRVYEGATLLAQLTTETAYNQTETRFGIRSLVSAAGTFYESINFANCDSWSSSSSWSPPEESSSSSSSSSSFSPESPESSSSSSSLTCEPPASSETVLDDVGRRQIAVDQPQGGTRYPFADPSDELDLLIGDLYLYYQDAVCRFEAPFSIAWLSGFGTQPFNNPTGCRHLYDMQIIDAQNRVVFDSRDAFSFSVTPWDTYRAILEWVTAEDEVLRVVIYRTWTAYETPRDWPFYFEPADARLDPRTTQRVPSAVTGLSIVTDLSDASKDVVLPVETNIVLRSGYNMTTTVQADADVDGTRRVTGLLIEAVPGEGEGQYPGCDPEPVLRRINDSEADEGGNLRLDALQCYRFERPLVVPAEPEPTESGVYVGPVRSVEIQEAALQISNNCGPCCECDDFVNVYEAIRKISQKYAALGRRAEAVRDQYAENILRWEEQRDCRSANLLQMAFLPVAPCRLAVAVSLCNGTRDPLLDVVLTMDFSGSTLAGCVVCNTTYRRGNVDPYRAVPPSRTLPYKLGGAWPVFYANFDCINPGENGYVTFVLQFPGCTQADTINLTLSASAAGGANPGGATPVDGSSGLIAYPDLGFCCETSESP